jgi:MFS family permease
LGATLLGTVSNNILNVPLHEITTSFHVPLSAGVLTVTSFVLVLAASMAFTGWVSDRVGRRRTLMWALALMVTAMVGAALAPSLGWLVAARGVQGLSCAAIPPSVMGLLSSIYPVGQRSRVMSAWAAANGVGQAIGPPLGGFLSDLWGWRSIFWVLVPIAILTLLGASVLPADRGRDTRLHWPGVFCLTSGAALVMTTATTVPQRAVPIWLDVLLGSAGLILLTLFVLVSRRAADPFIRPRLVVEPRFLRSAVASFAQMFALGTVLVAVPLYLTGEMGRTTAATGLFVFSLPATMAVLAPGVGLISDRVGPRRVLRCGLALLAVAAAGLGVFTDRGGHGLLVLAVLLVAVGAGVALVQTPAATGATRSPAGQVGSALGLYNMVRFSGSAIGTAWVAVIYPHGALLLLFVAASVILLLAFVVSFLGLDPHVVALESRDASGITSA